MKIIKIKLKKVAWGRQRPRGRRLDSPALMHAQAHKNDLIRCEIAYNEKFNHIVKFKIAARVVSPSGHPCSRLLTGRRFF